jgi:hypothetical protein
VWSIYRDAGDGRRVNGIGRRNPFLCIPTRLRAARHHSILLSSAILLSGQTNKTNLVASGSGRDRYDDLPKIFVMVSSMQAAAWAVKSPIGFSAKLLTAFITAFDRACCYLPVKTLH